MNIKNMLKSSRKRILHIALLSLVLNTVYALGNFALGIWSRSYWFLTMGAYNLILAIMRFSVVMSDRKNDKKCFRGFLFKDLSE